jgi:hypothetical protein
VRRASVGHHPRGGLGDATGGVDPQQAGGAEGVVGQTPAAHVHETVIAQHDHVRRLQAATGVEVGEQRRH